MARQMCASLRRCTTLAASTSRSVITPLLDPTTSGLSRCVVSKRFGPCTGMRFKSSVRHGFICKEESSYARHLHVRQLVCCAFTAVCL